MNGKSAGVAESIEGKLMNGQNDKEPIDLAL